MAAILSWPRCIDNDDNIIDSEITIHKGMILSFYELMLIIYIVLNSIFNFCDLLLMYFILHKH